MNEYMNKYGLNNGLNESDKLEYNSVLGLCSLFDTRNNIEAQNKLYDLIKSIIDNENVDYLSKLYKIEMLLNMNKSLKEYHNEMWHFSNKDIEDQK